MGLHFYDCYEFLTEGLSDNVVVWQGYPYSVLWYAFFFVALQVTLYPKQRKHQFVSDGVRSFSSPLIFTPSTLICCVHLFHLLCPQVHLYEIYFGNCLMQAWLPTAKKEA